MKPEDCIFFQLAKASQSAIRFWSHKASRLNLTAVQAMVLRFLYEKDSIASRELGERTQLDSATLTGILDRLESIDFLERRQNPNDRRAILVCLTEKGSEVSKKLDTLLEDANIEFLRNFSDEEKGLLRNFLLRIRYGKE